VAGEAVFPGETSNIGGRQVEPAGCYRNGPGRRGRLREAWFEGTPTEPLPFGPVCFLLNLESAELRGRLTLTPVDSSIPDLAPEEVGTLDHPLNSFARSSDALRACGLLEDTIPPGSGVRDNARQGTPEAQVWGSLQVTADQIRAIMVEVASADDPELAHLRIVAERQGISLVVRVLGGT
jgi:hypothetical protein